MEKVDTVVYLTVNYIIILNNIIINIKFRFFITS